MSFRDAWLDLVHGGRCLGCDRPGRLLCPRCEAELPDTAMSVRPTPCPEGLAPTFAAGEYADPLRSLILAHKEHQAFGLARPLGRVLAGVVAGIRAAADGPAPDELVLVPVPSRPEVVRRRGHDPLLRITRVAARGPGAQGGHPVVRLLRQRLAPNDQAGLDSIQRRANLAGSLAARAAPLRALARSGRPVRAIVCDDVLTTGATAREAQRALEEVGVPVLAVATIAATRKRLSHSPPGG